MKYGKKNPDIPVVVLFSLLLVVGIIYLFPTVYVWGQSPDNELPKAEGSVSLEEKIEAVTATVESSMSDYIDWLTAPAPYKILIDTEQEFDSRLAAYRYIVEQCILQYGEPGTETEQSWFLCKGLSFLKLVDFDNDGNDELVLVFCAVPDEASVNERTLRDGYAFVFNIWGYNNGKAVLLQDGQNLYVTNGGVQSVQIITNEFGTFLEKGGSDSFSYDYFYGYTDTGFGLVKNLMYEWTDIGDYWIDGEKVSKESWMPENEAWNAYWDDERVDWYMLRGTGSENMYKTLNQTNETLAFLRKE